MSNDTKAPAPVTAAQIGCGYWGPNLLRNFAALDGCRVKYVVEQSEERRRFALKAVPGIQAIPDAAPVLADPAVDAVIVATPAHTHFELALAALRAGKHVFVEKPLATSGREVEELGRVAAEVGRVLMVGHTFLYNSAVRYVKKMIDGGELGEVRYIYCQRLNLGRIRADVDAWWNLAPHDVSIVQYWLNDLEPTRVTRTGMAYIQDKVDDVVFVTLQYPNRVMANIHVSWLDPHKTRKIVIVGSKRMVVYDDTADNKIVIFDKGIDKVARLGEDMHYDRLAVERFNYRSGDIVCPGIAYPEPLREEARHFLECIQKGTRCLTGPEHARTVVSILERADAARA